LAFSLATALLYAPLIALILVLYPPDYGFTEWIFIAISGMLHLLYAVTLNRGYRLADLSIVYPVARGTGRITLDRRSCPDPP
jgi:hypothetical protein